jgi:hypothetical protein
LIKCIYFFLRKSSKNRLPLKQRKLNSTFVASKSSKKRYRKRYGNAPQKQVFVRMAERQLRNCIKAQRAISYYWVLGMTIPVF